VFFVVLIALIFLLVWCSPAVSGFFAWTGYLFTGYAFRGRLSRLAGATSVAVANAIAQIGGFPVIAHPGHGGTSRSCWCSTS
jgi:hypothetical protein